MSAPYMKLGGVYNTTAGLTYSAALAITNGAVTVGGGSDPTNNGVLFMDGGNGDNTANSAVISLSH